MLQNDLGSYAQDAVNAGAASSASRLLKVLEIQRDWILNKAAGISENFDYSYGTSILPLPSPSMPNTTTYPSHTLSQLSSSNFLQPLPNRDSLSHSMLSHYALESR
jgi:hypothetical protein